MEKRMEIEVSKSGIPCLWEKGGAMTNTGTAQIICGPNGEQKKAIYVPTGGHLACGAHALLPIVVGDHVVQVARWRDKVTVVVYQITSIDPPQQPTSTATARGCTLVELTETSTALEPAVEAAIEKANDYHCRIAMYIREKEDGKKL